MNPYLIEFEIRERRREMLAEASRRRLVGLFDANNKSATDRLFLALADLLIGLGEKLRRRHEHHDALAGGVSGE